MNNKRLSSIDVANYIVDYVNSTLKKKNLTPIKLQKILYYVYVNCLVKYEVSIFDEKIEKWKFGPVVSSVYHSFKIHGTSHIESTADSYKFSDNADGGFSFEIIPFDRTNVELSPFINEINSTIVKYIDKGPFELVELTHQEEPWKKYENQILSGAKGLVYTDREILNYFKK
ncbi:MULTISPECIES: Panacea domain-containing protein [Acinetobacter]|uniref:DUF4065 domain-containing protein n=1 Tax=Acinetobacter wuhouensis TaxID=1879050 RepID=A0A3G2SYL1_9GAMM|nr:MULTISPECIES: type II toxin-antitoxin system antitoxin SocA domain-containing protein [Acinetobacter]AYO52782.1 DUF4065 domain-containing protein [Acinetobacter wuhouensis]RZG76977.1 DUF4065 domain-containing protein [Acinetobacter sp. WCHAc060025]